MEVPVLSRTQQLIHTGLIQSSHLQQLHQTLRELEEDRLPEAVVQMLSILKKTSTLEAARLADNQIDAIQKALGTYGHSRGASLPEQFLRLARPQAEAAQKGDPLLSKPQQETLSQDDQARQRNEMECQLKCIEMLGSYQQEESMSELLRVGWQCHQSHFF